MRILSTGLLCLSLLCLQHSTLSAGLFSKKPPKVFGVEQHIWDTLTKEQKDKVIEGHTQRKHEKELRKEIEDLQKENRKLRKELSKQHKHSSPFNALFGETSSPSNACQASNLWLTDFYKDGIDTIVTLSNGRHYRVVGAFWADKWTGGQCVYLKSRGGKHYQITNPENDDYLWLELL